MVLSIVITAIYSLANFGAFEKKKRSVGWRCNWKQNQNEQPFGEEIFVRS